MAIVNPSAILVLLIIIGSEHTRWRLLINSIAYWAKREPMGLRLRAPRN